MATLELCPTISENLRVLQKPSLFLDNRKILDLTGNLQPVTELLAPFHKGSEIVPSDV